MLTRLRAGLLTYWLTGQFLWDLLAGILFREPKYVSEVRCVIGQCGGDSCENCFIVETVDVLPVTLTVETVKSVALSKL